MKTSIRFGGVAKWRSTCVYNPRFSPVNLRISPVTPCALPVTPLGVIDILSLLLNRFYRSIIAYF